MRVNDGHARRAKAALAAASAFLTGAAMLIVADPIGASTESVPGTATELATHEWAAGQPTAQGRQILDLEVHDGKVWAGYGDYGANTGPITLAAYDPTSGGDFAAATTVDTEAIYNLRSVGDTLVAPATDPRRNADFALGDPWRQDRPLGATHVFDTTTLTGTDLWMVGSQGADAVAWRSLDGGQTWTESLRQSPTSGAANDFLRFYFAAPLDGTLYVQAVSYATGASTSSKVFDGTRWSDGLSLLSQGGVGWKPQPFAGGLVYGNTGQGKAGGIYFFDGRSVTTVGVGWDVEVRDGTAFMLDLEGRILASTDASTWTPVGASDHRSRSIAIDGSTAYFGTADSRLLTAPISTPMSPADAIDETTTTTTAQKVHGPPTKSNESKCPKGWVKKGRC